jgi:predicted phosphodiesterase
LPAAAAASKVAGGEAIDAMKLHIVSDLHLSVAGFQLPATDADVIVLAGDIARPAEACAWARQLNKPVIYVAGNHEFYGSSLDDTLAALRQHSAGSHVHVLEGDAVVIDGVRFLGTTLWTDFALFDTTGQRAAAEAQALAMIRDFSRIRADASSARPFTPADSVAWFNRSAAWLERQLSEPFDGPTVVVTHHAPSLRSVHPRFENSLLNACFVSNAEHLLDGRRAKLWIHGHTHDSFDYTVHGTRVLCNPRGYAKHGVNENAAFDAELVVAV